MDGELVDAARRGVQADEQFHDSRRKTRHTTMVKSPENSETRCQPVGVSRESPRRNVALNDDGRDIEADAKLCRGRGRRETIIYRCVWC